MASITTPTTNDEWTLAELLDRFGPIPFRRIRQDPAPGCATEEDVIAIHDREGRLYELVDGILLEKTMGFLESYVAVLIASRLIDFVQPRQLGIVAGADGMVRLFPGMIRIPDVCFVAWDRITPGLIDSKNPAPDLAPHLAVEVLSRSNSKREMDEKLADYFAAGVRLVWYFDPRTRNVTIHDGPGVSTVLGENDTLDGGAILPGFALPLKGLFDLPTPPAANA